MRLFAQLTARIRSHFTADQFRALQLVVGVWCAVLVGTSYAFGILAHEMKQQFGLSQSQLTTVSTIGLGFAFFPLPIGVLYDWVGPQFVCIVATAMMAMGFFGNAMIFAGVLPGSVVMLSVTAVLTFWSSGFYDVGTLLTSLFLFPLNRGNVIAIQKTFMGLGASVLAVLYNGFFPNMFTLYSLFTASLIVVVGCIAIVIIDHPPYQRQKLKCQKSRECSTVQLSASVEQLGQVNEEQLPATVAEAEELLDKFILNTPAHPKRINVGFVVLGTLGTLLAVSSIVTAVAGFPQFVNTGFAVVVIVLLLSFLLMIHGTHGSTTALLPITQDGEMAAARNAASNVTEARKLYDLRFAQSLKTIDFWIIWFNSAVNWGASATIILNVPDIYRAANDGEYADAYNAMYVALCGIGSAIGRIGVGLSDTFVTYERKRSITVLLPLFPLICAVSLIAFIWFPPWALFFPFILSQIGYGGGAACTVLASRLMYKIDVATHYYFFFSGGLVGLIVVNRVLFGPLFDREGHTQGAYPHCSGVQCFSITFYIVACANAVSCLMMFFVHRRWLAKYFDADAEGIAPSACSLATVEGSESKTDNSTVK